MEPADLLYSESRFGWTDVPHQHKPASLAWAIGKPLAQQRQADYSAAPAKHLNRLLSGGKPNPCKAQRSSAYIAPAAKTESLALPLLRRVNALASVVIALRDSDGY